MLFSTQRSELIKREMKNTEVDSKNFVFISIRESNKSNQGLPNEISLLVLLDYCTCERHSPNQLGPAHFHWSDIYEKGRKTQTLTHVESCIPADSENRQPCRFLSQSLCIPPLACLPGQTPPRLQHLLRTRTSFFQIFLAVWQNGVWEVFWSQRDAF